MNSGIAFCDIKYILINLPPVEKNLKEIWKIEGGTQIHLKLFILGVNYAENTSKEPKVTEIRNFQAIG